MHGWAFRGQLSVSECLYRSDYCINVGSLFLLSPEGIIKFTLHLESKLCSAPAGAINRCFFLLLFLKILMKSEDVVELMGCRGRHQSLPAHSFQKLSIQSMYTVHVIHKHMSFLGKILRHYWLSCILIYRNLNFSSRKMEDMLTQETPSWLGTKHQRSLGNLFTFKMKV